MVDDDADIAVIICFVFCDIPLLAQVIDLVSDSNVHETTSVGRHRIPVLCRIDYRITACVSKGANPGPLDRRVRAVLELIANVNSQNRAGRLYQDLV